jgi:hypothetical protein
MQIYPWLVFLHLIGVLGLMFSHGSAAFVSYRIRSERNLERITGLLELVHITNVFLYPSFYLLLIAGILAGIVGRWFGHGWIWAALIILIAITVAMIAIASPYYNGLRQAVGLPVGGRGRAQPASAPISAAELASKLQSRRPDLLAAVGLGGLLVILWLMVMKPF